MELLDGIKHAHTLFLLLQQIPVDLLLTSLITPSTFTSSLLITSLQWTFIRSHSFTISKSPHRRKSHTFVLSSTTGHLNDTITSNSVSVRHIETPLRNDLVLHFFFSRTCAPHLVYFFKSSSVSMCHCPCTSPPITTFQLGFSITIINNSLHQLSFTVCECPQNLVRGRSHGRCPRWRFKQNWCCVRLKKTVKHHF